MFWVTWLLTASSITEAIAARNSHLNCTTQPSGVAAASLLAALEPGPPTTARTEPHAVAAHRATRQANRPDQAHPSCGSVKYGSSNTGKPIRASSDAKFDNANRRYGTTLLNR